MFQIQRFLEACRHHRGRTKSFQQIVNVVNCKQDVHFNESFRPGGGRKGKDYYNKNPEISKNKQRINGQVV